MMTENEKARLRTIPKEHFEDIGHKQDDWELNFKDFIQHRKEVMKYLNANGRHTN